MGLGGAFVALADDATAAFANPSGLVQLLRPEVSVEARSSSFSTPFTRSGRAEGRPSGIGIDTEAGLIAARSSADLEGAVFLSIVYPRRSWALAVYRHQLADFESFNETQGIFGGGDTVEARRFLDRRGSTDLDIIGHGIAGAYRVTEKLSLGVGISYFDGTMLLTTATFRPDDDSVASRFAPNSYLPARNFARTSVVMDSRDWAVTGSVLWRVSDRWRLGAVYRQGAAFEFDAEVFVGPAFDPAVAAGTLLARASSRFQIPDVVGLGVSFRSRDGSLTTGLEWDRVEYSDVVDGLSSAVANPEELVLEDADEIHLGAEYAFLRSKPLIAVRAGAWLDPEHRLQSRGDDPFDRALLRPGDDEIHVAAGLGVAFSRLQIDLGADFSSLVDTASLSAIYTF